MRPGRQAAGRAVTRLALALVLLTAACGGEESGPPLELRPFATPFVGPVYEPPEPEPVREPRPLEVVLDRVARTVPADARGAAWGLLGYLAAGETWKHGSHRETVRQLLEVVRAVDSADPLVALALAEAHALTLSPQVRDAASAAAARVKLPPDAPPGAGGLAALVLFRRSALADPRQREEDGARVRAWVEHDWDEAMQEGGVSLAAKTLGRILLGDRPRKEPDLAAALDRLNDEGPPVRDGRVTDPTHLYLADRLFWRVFWWNSGDRKSGTRWRKARRAATLPIPEDATYPEIAALASSLAGDEVICVYGGFLTTFAGR